MSTFKVIWRNAPIGTYTVTAIDMWYWDGLFTPVKTAAADKFVGFAMTLDMKAAIDDPRISTWLLLDPENEDSNPTYVLVLGMTAANQLSVRMLYDPKAIDWLIKNVDVQEKA